MVETESRSNRLEHGIGINTEQPKGTADFRDYSSNEEQCHLRDLLTLTHIKITTRYGCV